MTANSGIGGRIGRAIVSGMMVFVGVALYVHTYNEKYHTGFAASDPNAMILPHALLAMMIVLGSVAFWQDLRMSIATRPSSRVATVVLPAALLIATALVTYVGFVLAVAPLTAVVIIALGERRWPVVLATTAIVGVGFWYFFHHVLLIRLPSIASGGAF